MSISPDRLLYEDPHLLAVNKLSGELVVKGKGQVQKLPLFDFLKKEHPGLRAVHRLDFETSGVVVFAKSKQALDAILASDFSGWGKTYLTLVAGRMARERGTVSFSLPSRGDHKNIPAETKYRVLERFVNSSYVEAVIATGRHHQIRRHFQKIGHPLVLDDEYGNPKFNRVFTQEFHLRKFFLHASALTFPHPVTGKQIHIEAPLPRPFEEVLKKLRSLSS